MTVFYDLSEQEMRALEEVIGRDPTGEIVGKYGYALFNERPGEYTKYLRAWSRRERELRNEEAAARFAFFADVLPR